MKLDMSLTKRQKKALLIAGIIVLVVFVPIYCVRSYKAKKAERAINIAYNYCRQNEAFELGTYQDEYLPYEVDEFRLAELEIKLNAYNYMTGETCTTDDIKKFLETSKNPDGSPKTYEDDNGAVGKYVNWYYDCDRYWETYRDNISYIFSEYTYKSPKYDKHNFYKLTTEQIDEICKWYGTDSNGNKIESGKEVDKYPYENLYLE